MKKQLVILFIAVLAIYLPFTGCQKGGPINPEQELVQTSELNDYIVVLSDYIKSTIQAPGSIKGIVSEMLSKYQIPETNLNVVWEHALKGFSVKLTAEQLKNLRSDSRIKFIEPNRKVQFIDPVINDNPKENQIQAQKTSWGITAVRGFVNCSSLTSRVAWIIDTGIDLDHSDLNVAVSRCTTFVSSGNDALTADDGNGHGTHVAGIIAAKNNTIGCVGVAAGAPVIAVKVLDYSGSGTYEDVISGVNYVASVAESDDVANMSLGGPADAGIDEAVNGLAARCKVCVAAGNSAANAGNYSPSRVSSAYTVASFADGKRTYSWSYFSNYGSVVDCIEPGSSIYSTYKNNRYATMSGTSMASPFLAGILLATGGTLYQNALKSVSGVPTGTTTVIKTVR